MAKTKTQVNQAEKIRDAYIAYVLEHGSAPASIFKFVKELKIKEEVFYDHYNSFQNIDKAIWEGWFDDTLKAITSDEVYEEYSVREKLLAFYYTFVEGLKSNRSFILQTVHISKKPDLKPACLDSLKPKFDAFINDLLLEAKEVGEITDRPVIGKRYGDAIWLQFLFVVGFWIKDDSKSFETTDAAIEKAVNLSFELMAKGPLESMIDFGKFLFQNR